jgi:tetrahydromethanopterin S-methyltransferase subunit G
MKNKKINFIILGIILFSTLTAFKIPTSISSREIVISTDVSDEDDYETVMRELEELERQVESEMSEEDRLAWTPVVGIVTRSVAVLRGAVAVGRAAVVLTRAATVHTPRIAEAARTAGGTMQLLTSILGIAKVQKISDSEYYNKMSEYQLFMLG